MNLLPILTRWPTKLDLLLLYLLTSKAVMGGIFWGFWYVMVCELDDESYQTVWRDWRGSEERQSALHLCRQVRFVFNLYLYFWLGLTICSFQVCEAASAVAEPWDCWESDSQHRGQPRCWNNIMNCHKEKMVNLGLNFNNNLFLWFPLLIGIWKCPHQVSKPLTG